MKKLVIALSIALSSVVSIMASVGNPNTLHEYVKEGYSVGYTVSDSLAISCDMCMYCIGEDLIPGWYVAYNLEEGTYYYITQDTAQEWRM